MKTPTSQTGYSRRDFVSRSGAALALAALPRHLTAARNARVLVVGAGPAGLTAAYELQAAGHDVRVFEARARAGGRIRTLREPFSGDLYAEAGALALVSNNPGLEYAREFGLEVVPLPFSRLLQQFVVRGERLVARPGEPMAWPVPLEGDEEGLAHFALANTYLRGPVSALPETERLDLGAALTDAVLHLDQRSLDDLLQDAGASDGARELLRMGYFQGYLEPAAVSVLHYALERGGFRRTEGYFTIAGGNDRLCQALADRLGDAVEYDRAVRSVRQSTGGVRLGVDGPSGLETVEGDFIVLTPPPPVLRRLVFEPALDPRVMRSFHELRSIRATRVFTETASRFWEARGWSGSVVTDGPLGSVAHSTQGQPGPRGILESFTFDEHADRLAALSETARLARFRQGLDELFPGGSDVSDRGASHAWGEDPWARCNLVAFEPGQVAEFLPAMREAQGRVFLAGDTVGGIPGYSHAAFWSGRDVAARIIEAA